MAILTRAGLLAALPDNDSGVITPEVLRNVVDSLIGIGGTMYGNDEVLPVTTAWAAFPAFTASIDTKGITEDLPNGQFTIGAGGDGVYFVDASLGVFSAFSGWIEIAVTKNGNLTPYRKKRTLTAGGDGEFGIPASGNLVAGDTVGLAIRASGNADVTLTNGQYRVIRA